jgi:hypothetical protein
MFDFQYSCLLLDVEHQTVLSRLVVVLFLATDTQQPVLVQFPPRHKQIHQIPHTRFDFNSNMGALKFFRL